MLNTTPYFVFFPSLEAYLFDSLHFTYTYNRYRIAEKEVSFQYFTTTFLSEMGFCFSYLFI